MKCMIAVVLCKLLAFAGSLVGKGTSLPGKVVLKIFPDILHRIKLPQTVVAVTGSNGKTSTVEMIANVMEQSGKTVAWNKEGSNQIEGVTTLLLRNCSLSGKVKADAVVLESDERYAKRTFSYFTPTHFAIVNLYRDQLTRNGHPEWVYRSIADAVSPDVKLILNADDPLVSLLGKDRDAVYFGMEENAYSTHECSGIYNDGKYCPCCDGVMNYEYYHFGHIGRFRCENCGYGDFKRDFSVTRLDLDSKILTVNGEHNITLAFDGRYNVYNICAAFAVCALAGVEPEKIARCLSDFVMKNGRVVRFEAGENNGVLLTSKHENSVSYNQSIEYVVRRKKKTNVFFIVDEISRKYFTGETGWLWDIDFESLKNSTAENIYLCGTYAPDLALRFSLTDIEPERVKYVPNLDDMKKYLFEPTDNEIFVITCFSDKDKLLSRVKALTPTAK
ncbi:MAG: DUF1727 domain-containing protein [Clostridia bacterium]|nr:DUF1727 domain-containing protein [Clostridia bacterium]